MSQPLSPQLVMFRKELQSLPSLQLPDGYTIRSYREGDGAAWERIINESFQKTGSSFVQEVLTREPFRPERVMFALHGEEPVATAIAWHQAEWGDEVGYLHMVGLLKAHTGKGLGLQVSLAAMIQMAKEGRVSAVLHTDDFRAPAIKTYLKLGFIPKLVHDNQHQRWSNLADSLQLHPLRYIDRQGIEIEL